jgi:tetratricopeptide (TPR) repeat protein
MILKKVIITAGLLSLMVYFNHSIAQEIRCEEQYQLALTQYNYGLADSALSILEPCLLNQRIHKELTRGGSVNIYRLAALSSIMIGNPEDAEKYIKELLKYQPDYAENWREGDLMEFRYMIEGVSSQPSFKLGIWAGFNVPMLTLEKNYTDPEKPGAQFSLDGHTGFQIGAVSEMTISRNLALEAGVGMLHIRFDYQVQDPGIGEYQYEQEITYIEIPILMKYYLPLKGSLKPYLQGGVSGKFSLYLREDSEDYGKYRLTESSNSDNILATFITDLENLGIVVGGGITYNLKNINIGLDIRYAHHLKSEQKLAKFDDILGYEDIPSSEPFGYTNDINLITLSDLQISLIFTYNLKYRVY